MTGSESDKRPDALAREIADIFTRPLSDEDIALAKQELKEHPFEPRYQAGTHRLEARRPKADMVEAIIDSMKARGQKHQSLLRAAQKAKRMKSRLIVYEDRTISGRPFSGFYAQVQLGTGEKVFVELAKDTSGVAALVKRMRLGGLLPGDVLVRLPTDALVEFGHKTIELPTEERSRALLRALTKLVVEMGSVAAVVGILGDLGAEEVADLLVTEHMDLREPCDLA